MRSKMREVLGFFSNCLSHVFSCEFLKQRFLNVFFFSLYFLHFRRQIYVRALHFSCGWKKQLNSIALNNNQRGKEAKLQE